MLFKRILHVVVLAVLLLCLVMSVLYSILPFVVEKQIKKRMAGLQLPAAVDFTIDSIRWDKTMISDIRLNERQIIGHAEIEYHLKSIKTASIKRLVLSGVTPQISVSKDNQVEFHGIKISKPAKDAEHPQDLSFFKFLPDKIKINNSMLRLTLHGRSYVIPAAFMAVLEKKSKNVELKGDLFFFGEKVQVQARYQPGTGLSNMYVRTPTLDLGRYNRSIKGKIPDLVLNQAQDIVVISDMLDKKWQFKMGHLEFTHPLVSGIKDMVCTIDIENGEIKADGSAELLIEGADRGLFQFSAHKALDGKFPYSFRGSCDFGNSFIFTAGKNTIELTEPKIKVEAIANPKRMMGSFDVTGINGKGRLSGQTAEFSSIAFNSGFLADFSQKEYHLRFKPEVKITKPFAVHPQGELGFSKCLVGGIVSYSKTKGPIASLTVEAGNGKARITEKNIVLSGMNLMLPLHYPAVKKRQTGSIVIASIKLPNSHSGSIKAEISQTDNAMMAVDGRFKFDQIPGLRTPFRAKFNLLPRFSAVIDYRLNSFEITENEISKLVSNFPVNSIFKAMISAEGRTVMSGNRLETSLNVNVENGELSIPDIELEASGINTRIAFNDLLKPETRPGQTMGIDKIDIGKVNIKDAIVRFSVEDATYLLLENLKFKWCQGIVSTEAIRIPGPGNKYTLILYCDRLELTELLKQMGVFHAEGDGTLSGRLPVIYENGEISFDNGFLFSTPGSGGVVKIQNTEKLTAGIPMDSPQFSQLDVAREALKDFEYKWTKLNIDSFEDNLSVKMQMDGRPTRVLPFVYRKDLGRFVRVKADNPGSNFQGIKLDVNLNLPFNQVMKFGNQVKTLFN